MPQWKSNNYRQSRDGVSMKLSEARQIKPGDKVFWNDPSKTCSRIYDVKYVEIENNIILIEEPDGSVLECYAKELQWEKTST